MKCHPLRSARQIGGLTVTDGAHFHHFQKASWRTSATLALLRSIETRKDQKHGKPAQSDKALGKELRPGPALGLSATHELHRSGLMTRCQG